MRLWPRRGRRAFEGESEEGVTGGRTNDGASYSVSGVLEGICDGYYSGESRKGCGGGGW